MRKHEVETKPSIINPQLYSMKIKWKKGFETIDFSILKENALWRII